MVLNAFSATLINPLPSWKGLVLAFASWCYGQKVDHASHKKEKKEEKNRLPQVGVRGSKTSVNKLSYASVFDSDFSISLRKSAYYSDLFLRWMLQEKSEIMPVHSNMSNC